MNIYRILTTFKLSCSIYFIVSDLLFCKITLVFNPAFSFNYFINQVMKVFTAPSFFASEIQSNNRTVLCRYHFLCIFITETSALFHVSALISTILYIHKKFFFDGIKYSIILTVFQIIFVLSL